MSHTAHTSLDLIRIIRDPTVIFYTFTRKLWIINKHHVHRSKRKNRLKMWLPLTFIRLFSLPHRYTNVLCSHTQHSAPTVPFCFSWSLFESGDVICLDQSPSVLITHMLLPHSPASHHSPRPAACSHWSLPDCLCATVPKLISCLNLPLKHFQKLWPFPET